MTHALLKPQLLPAFSTVEPADIEAAIDQLLSDNRQAIETLLTNLQTPDWDSLVAPLEELNDQLAKAWSPVSHMNAVVNTDELRDAYNACLPKLSQYWTELGQNKTLFQAFKTLRESDGFDQLTQAQQKVITDQLRDFELSGIALPEAEQQRYSELKQRLSELTTRFSENVLDATGSWQKQVDDVNELVGMPEMAIGAAKQQAEAKELTGYLLTLDFPCYLAVMTHADNRELRREVYEAFSTRASDQGPDAGKFDNSDVMVEIMTLRQELAALLGFGNYAEYSLATKMAETTEQVVGFLTDLAEKSLPIARQEIAELTDYAREQHGVEELQAWDLTYYGEKLKHERYEVSQETLRPYFPLPKVLSGLFKVTDKLFDIQITEVEEFDRWHQDARLFEVRRQGELIARFYLDLYARDKKRGGAWMDDCRVRRQLDDGSLQLPTAYLVCNFSSPVGDDPSLLTHNEVTTLFHEFGHGLHHMMTKVDVADVSGINGVPWDAVELPSQFLENWCYEPEALADISGHYQTGEPLPKALLDKMLAAKNFQSGMMMVRQLEFSLFDFRLHMMFEAGKTEIQTVLDDVRKQVAVVIPPAFNRFQHGFSHIFAGGYAAGYYSYKWAEVLSADAFSKFEEDGIFNSQTGLAFRETILEQGGSREPMALFVEFRGREPQVDALLRHSGITVQ